MDNLIYKEVTGSTNDDAVKLAIKGAPHGFGVLAATQSAGKGRLGKQWLSPTGTGLYCSTILRPKLPFIEFSKITLTAGLALCKCLEQQVPGVDFGLKWPNDLYSEQKKCAGILVESSTPGSDDLDSFVVVGFGVNVNTSVMQFSEELRERAVSLKILSGIQFDIQNLYRQIHQSLLEHLVIQETFGFKTILEEWRLRDILLGKEMQWVTSERTLVRGIGLGPDDSGQLLVEDSSGRVHEILSGDVQLAEI